MRTPKHQINEIVEIIPNYGAIEYEGYKENDGIVVAIITNIIINKRGVYYKADVGFEEKIIYDTEEYEFKENAEPEYSIYRSAGTFNKE